ncbi:uncharacterized protein LOC135814396 [Sycon ciliatum]|uniref:uncharacterized protein LOC135814396 n=1 Tax=Sycon ciliatum TaxID=27933 RepID=UPI0020A9D67C|eukprot:scpid3759/ scgid24684/ 
MSRARHQLSPRNGCNSAVELLVDQQNLDSADVFMEDDSCKSLQRPLAETHSESARSLASTMSIPVAPASEMDCGASVGPDSGFESNTGTGSSLSHLVTGRSDASSGLIEAGIEQYLRGDLYTATLLLSEAAGQQTNHSLEVEYGVDDWSSGIALDSQRIPSWMSGDLSSDSVILEVYNRRLQQALKLIEAVPSVDKNYLVCGSVCCVLNQWDDAREFYRQGLAACSEKSRLRAALGSLNSIERHVRHAVERVEVESLSKPALARSALTRSTRAGSDLTPVPKPGGQGPRRKTFAGTSRSDSIASTTSASDTKGGSGKSRRLQSIMQRFGYKRNSQSVPEEEIPE